jgi:hypothetical protein
VIAKLPDEHAIRAIQLDVDVEPTVPDPGADDPPPGAAA